MNLLLEITPYQADIDNYLKGMGMTERRTQSALVDIWHRFENQPEIKAVIYPSVRVDSLMPPVDMACNDCFSRMIHRIKHWQDRLNSEAMVYFKGVPDGSKAKVTEIVIPKAKVIEIKKQKDPTLEIAEIKFQLIEKGIPFHQRHGLAKLRELNGKA